MGRSSSEENRPVRFQRRERQEGDALLLAGEPTAAHRPCVWMHGGPADHDPVLAPAIEPRRMLLRLLLGQDPGWVNDTDQDFKIVTVAPDGSSLLENFTGGWAACAQCARLVYTGRNRAVLARPRPPSPRPAWRARLSQGTHCAGLLRLLRLWPAPAHVREVSESPVGYATNENDGTVSVIDGRTNTVVATVPVGTFPIGVAVNPKANTAYVTDSGDNTVPVLTSCRGPAVAHGSAVGRCSTPRFSQFHTGARNLLPSSTRTMLRT